MLTSRRRAESDYWVQGFLKKELIKLIYIFEFIHQYFYLNEAFIKTLISWKNEAQAYQERQR
jgi:hypothetical protein